MRKILYLLSCFLCLLSSIFSQSPQTWTSADMFLAMRKLNVLGSVLYVAAHPDDENTRLLSYFAKDKMYRTGYLSITRGDGGQNLIGDEQGIDLGLIRTQELLAARRVDGAEQFFTRAFDFGYSKTPEETFTKWDHEKILSDVVWVIRKFQPDIIINRFPTTGEGGHGHHTASAILANEAFAAAGDPTRFPEQLKYVQAWQPRRILWNTFNFGGTNTQSPDQFKFDVGGYNPLLGKSYGEIAAISRSNHKSQGFGSAATRGELFDYFRTTGGTAPSDDIMNGVDMTWSRVKGAEAITAIIDNISQGFDLLHPEKSVKDLVQLYKALNQLPDSYWKSKKLKETQVLIEQCSGLFIDATTNGQFAVQTDSVRINFILNNRLGVNAVLKNINIDAFDSTFNLLLTKNKNTGFGKTFFVPADKPVTQPYWLEEKMEEGYFNVKDQRKIGQPDVDPSYLVNIMLNIEGVDFVFSRAVKYKFTDPVKGEVYWPIVVIPSYTVKILPEIVIVKQQKPMEHSQGDFESVFTSYKSNNEIKVTNESMLSKGSYVQYSLILNKESKTIPDTLGADPYPGTGRLHISLDTIKLFNFISKQRLYDVFSIKHDHIPAIAYFKPASIVKKSFAYETYNKKIGYIPGAGDKVPEILDQMGYEVTILGEKDLSRNKLGQFDAIITGVRCYNTNEWMNNNYEKLMKYVHEGGNLIVQYNTSSNLGPVRAKIGPDKFDITRNRVTDENALVTLLKPDHPAFNFPNKITQDDFIGWVQERSIYHARDTLGKYEKLIGIADPGEKSDDGSLIVQKHGKGWFTYTGLVFFRELPAGVPGAYRLLANLIALNKKKGF